MFILLIPIFIFFELGIIHFIFYYSAGKINVKLSFGLHLYVTGLVAGVISYIADWYVIYPVLFKQLSEGAMMGVGLFMFFSWFIVPVFYLIVLSIFYLYKRKSKSKKQ